MIYSPSLAQQCVRIWFFHDMTGLKCIGMVFLRPSITGGVTFIARDPFTGPGGATHDGCVCLKHFCRGNNDGYIFYRLFSEK